MYYWASGSEPTYLVPSRTAAIIFPIYIRPSVLAPGWPRATRKRSRPDHTCKYIIRIYTCIHMYTYVYTWSKLAYCETTTPAMEMTREATERLQKRQERLRKRQEGPADPRFRQQRLRKLSLRQRSRSPLSESQQRRDDRLSRRRERERKRRLRKQQRNERYAWGGVGRETELGGLLRLWRPNQRKERLA